MRLLHALREVIDYSGWLLVSFKKQGRETAPARRLRRRAWSSASASHLHLLHLEACHIRCLLSVSRVSGCFRLLWAVPALLSRYSKEWHLVNVSRWIRGLAPDKCRHTGNRRLPAIYAGRGDVSLPLRKHPASCDDANKGPVAGLLIRSAGFYLIMPEASLCAALTLLNDVSGWPSGNFAAANPLQNCRSSFPICIYIPMKKNIIYYGKSDRQSLRFRVLFLIQTLTAPVAKAFASCSGSFSVA